MKMINLTQHAIVACNSDGKPDFTLPASGQVARVGVDRVRIDTVDNDGAGEGVPVFISSYKDVSGLPAMQEDTWLVVSAMVRKAMPLRIDLLSPGELVRDESGNPVGCMGFDRNP